MVFCFAIEAALRGGSEVIEMGEPIFPAASFYGAETVGAPIDFSRLGLPGVDQIVIVNCIKCHGIP
jgi:hypothetical protein